MESAVTIHPSRDKSKSSAAAEGSGLVPLSFPATRAALWDHRSKGPPSIIHISHYRSPNLIIEEKTLRLVQRFAQETEAAVYSCLLIGCIQTDHDEEGIQLSIDRFHDGNQVDPDPDQLVVPCVVHKNTSSLGCPAVEEITSSLKLVHQRCMSKDKIEMSQFLSVRANCGYHASQIGHVFHVDFDVVTMETTFKATPISPVPLVPTALSKNLSGPMSMSELQGEPKTGYITMDQTRKGLLVLESDPKVATLPLVGIWVSGVANVYHPVVWASCLRYLHNSSLQDRVCIPPESFLLILYSPLHSRPEFYDCCTTDGKTQLSYQLLTCHDVLQLSKDLVARPETPLELELCNVESGSRRDVFYAALENNRQLMTTCNKPAMAVSQQSGSMEDITPRVLPSPHYTQTAFMKPAVPEVTLIFDDNESGFEDLQSHMQSHPSTVGNQRKSNSSFRGPLKPVNRHNDCIQQPKVQKPVIQKQITGPMNAGRAKVSMHHEMPQSHVHPSNVPVSSQTGRIVSSQPVYTSAPGHVAHRPSFRPHLMQAYQPEQYSHPEARHCFQPPMHASSHARADFPNPVNPNLTYPHGYESSNLAPNRPQPPIPHAMQPVDARPYVPPQNAYQQMYNPGMPPTHGQFYPQYQSSSPVYQPQQPMYQNYPGAAVQHIAPQSQFQEPHPIPQPQSLPSQSSGELGLDRLTNVLAQHGRPHQWPQGPNHGSSSTHIVQATGQQYIGSHKGEQSKNSIHTSQTRLQVPSHSGQSKSAPCSPESHLSLEQTASSTSSPAQHVAAGAGIMDATLGSQASAGSGSEVPAEVYELLRQQDMQLKVLREQLQQLLSKQQSTDSKTEVQPPSQNTECKSVDIQTSALSSPIKSKQSDNETKLKQTCSVAINTSICWPAQTANQSAPTQNVCSSNTDYQVHHRDNNSVDTFHSASHVLNSTAAISPVRQHGPKAKPGSKGSSPGQHSSDPSATLSNESFGDLHLTNLHDRTEESMMSEMVVDMPAYTSLSPDKLGNPGGSSGYEYSDDSVRSPLMGESVSMYQNQLIEGREHSGHGSYQHDQEDSGDTGLGDSHPEASLLFHDQKQFYENLIGSVKKFLAKHTDQDPQKENTVQRSQSTPTSPSHPNPNHYHVEETKLPDVVGKALHSSSNTLNDDGSYLGGHIPHPGSQKTHMPTPKVQSSSRPVHHVASAPGALQNEDPIPDFSHLSIDVEAYTRQQLRKMGIDLDKLSETEKTQWLNQSIMVMEPAMLPKIQYVSMLHDSDTDMSADADSLAMKYLNDEQLSELAKLRLHSPKKFRQGQQQGLNRLLTSGAGSANVTMYGMHDKNMSFATRKYMQRYGLIDGEKREAEISASGEAPAVDGVPEAYNVKEFLEKLAERSFMGNSFVSVNGNSRQNQRLLRGSVDSSTGTSSHSSHQEEHLQYHSDGESFRVFGSSNASPACHRQYSTTSDTTQYRSPDHRPVQHQRYQQRPEWEGSAQTPVRVFDTSKHLKGEQQQRNMNTQHRYQRSEEHRGQRSENSDSPQNNRILDIERLKELPKLL